MKNYEYMTYVICQPFVSKGLGQNITEGIQRENCDIIIAVIKLIKPIYNKKNSILVCRTAVCNRISLIKKMTVICNITKIKYTYTRIG